VPTVLSDHRLDVDPRSGLRAGELVPALSEHRQSGPSWLGNAHLAMMSLIIVNVWRGLPFYGITLLAGLQTISPELYEAATIDGASTRLSNWQRHVDEPVPGAGAIDGRRLIEFRRDRLQTCEQRDAVRMANRARH